MAVAFLKPLSVPFTRTWSAETDPSEGR